MYVCIYTYITWFCDHGSSHFHGKMSKAFSRPRQVSVLKKGILCKGLTFTFPFHKMLKSYLPNRHFSENYDVLKSMSKAILW